MQRIGKVHFEEKLIKFATRIPIFMYLTDYREYSLRDVITQLEPGLFKRVTGLDVKDFELLVSLGVFNGPLMNDAVYKFKRYEDASLSYTGINKHEGEKVGGFDTVLSQEEYRRLYGEQQKTLGQIVSLGETKKPTSDSEKSLVNKPVHVSKPVSTSFIDKEEKIQIISEGGFICQVGQQVSHTSFGVGIIKSFFGDKIIVAFGKAEKMFVYPDAFKKGFLTLK